MNLRGTVVQEEVEGARAPSRPLYVATPLIKQCTPLPYTYYNNYKAQ